MAHWTDAYVGRPYVRGADDCAQLAIDVQRERFGRIVAIPAERPAGPALAAALIDDARARLVRPIAAPEEGCAILLRRGALARPWHIATYFALSGEGWLLHTTATTGAATTARLRDLPRLGLQIEGYYAWI